jgi:hypothetical protein
MTYPAYTVPARMEGPWFRVFRIDFDDSEEVAAVHAICDRATWDVIQAMTNGLDLRMDVAGVGQYHAEARLPLAVVLELYRATGKVRGDAPRYPHTHVVNESLNWVYCSLISEE